MKTVFVVLLALLTSYSTASAQNVASMQLPRYASLRSNLVNSRSGPGRRYPIEWVYTQKKAPVEVLQSYEYQKELWYQIRDWENSESWVHHSMISKDRTAKVITPGENNLYKKPDYSAKVIAKVESDVIGKILKCPQSKAFCLVKFQSIEGWIPRKDIFGVYEKEEIK